MGNTEKSYLKEVIREANNKVKKNKDEDQPIVYKSFISNENYIYEQCYDPEKNKSYYVKWDKKKRKYILISEDIIDGITHQPINADELVKGAVLLPNFPEEYNSNDELDQAIVDHIHNWLDVSPEYEKMAMYNIKLSWVYERFNTLNYTRALGDTGTGKSVSGEAKCLYKWRHTYGNMAIKDIFSKYENNFDGLEIQAINMDSGQIKWSKVTNLYKHLANNLIKIKTYSGREIIATKDHSFLKWDNGKIISIKGEELKCGNKLPIAKYKNTNIIKEIQLCEVRGTSTKNNKLKIPLNYDFGFIIGMVLAEGDIHKKRVDISVCNEKLQEITSKYLNRLNICFSKTKKNISIGMSFRDFLVNKMLTEVKRNGKGGKSEAKKIPNFCIFSPDEFKFGLLSGFICGDGTIENESTISITTISKNLASGLMDIAHSVDFASKMREKKYTYKGIKRIAYNVHIYGDYNLLNLPIKQPKKEVKQEYLDKIPFAKEIYVVLNKNGFNKKKGICAKEKRLIMGQLRTRINRDGGFVGRNQTIRFIKRCEEFGVNLEEIKTRIKKHNVFWDTILSITPYNKKETVYDFEVEENTFVANGIAVHNSRFLFTLGHLHYKPMIVAGALTPAVVFRIINKWKGTLLIDEGDQQNSDESNSFIKIMNCGYEKGMPVSRCDKNDPNKLDFFDVFCPKVITTRKRFEDKATESRCMTNIMVQTFRNDIPDILTQKYYDSVNSLRNKLLLWRLRNYDTIDPEAGFRVNLDKYEPRLRQVNRSFVSLFADNQNRLNEFFAHLDKYQSAIIQERAESFEGIIINVLAEQVVGGKEAITPADISQSVNNDATINLPYALSPQKVSKILSGMGMVFQRKKHQGTTKNSLNLEKIKLKSIFSRYINNEELINKLNLKGYEVTKVTIDTMTGYPIVPKNEGAGFDTFKNPQALRIRRNFRNSVTAPDQNSYLPTLKDILEHISRFGSDGTMSVIDLIDDLGIDDDTIDILKRDGLVFEPFPGQIKRL